MGFNPWFVGAMLLHIVSRKLLLWKIIFDKNCRGISLITQEAFLVLYVSRYLDLLYLYTSLFETVIKILHLVVSLAIVGLMRFSPNVASSYDADLDTVPRALLLIPPFLLALLFNKVVLVMEIFHQYSSYLEVVVLLPQFVLLYRREKYEAWAFVYTLLAGGESAVRNAPMLLGWKLALKDSPYALYAASAQLLVFVIGLGMLVVQQISVRQQASLNEGTNKPAFDEVWEADKFRFEDEEGGAKAKTAADQKQ